MSAPGRTRGVDRSALHPGAASGPPDHRALHATLAAAAIAATALAVSACTSVSAEPVLAQRGHAQCPLAGTDERTLLIDSAADWRIVWAVDEAAALGRAVDWARERVLVHALAQQPTLGVRVEAVAIGGASAGGVPRLGLRVTRPGPNEMAAMALSRPCVVVAVARGSWQTLQLVDADRPERALATATVGPAEAGPRKFPHGAPAAPR